MDKKFRTNVRKLAKAKSFREIQSHSEIFNRNVNKDSKILTEFFFVKKKNLMEPEFLIVEEISYRTLLTCEFQLQLTGPQTY